MLKDQNLTLSAFCIFFTSSLAVLIFYLFFISLALRFGGIFYY